LAAPQLSTPQIDSTTAWKNFLQGDKSAFEEIYNRYYERLYQYGKHLATDENLVRDSIQTLFVDLWQRQTHLSITTNVQGYLLKALRRVIVKQLQEERKKATSFAHMSISPEEAIIQEETDQLNQQRVHRALAQLTQHQREVVHLRFFANLSNQQIASTLNISVATVYNIISLSLAKLRNHYAEKTIFIWLTSLLIC